MTQALDLATWQERQDALLEELPSDVAKRIRGYVTIELRRELATGDGPPLQLLTADEILTTDWPKPQWVIDEILPEGLTLLVGKAKRGKSWLALQVAHSVASGGIALGKKVEKGRVLYIAIEDKPRRLRERMDKQGWKTGAGAVDFMAGEEEFRLQLGDLRNGGSERLARQIKHCGYRYVVIDTFSRSTTGDQNDVADMTLALAPLHSIAHEYSCAIVMIDHMHKMAGRLGLDVITDVLGSTAKGAMADTLWGLYRESGKAGAKLAITGRDVDERTLALRMDWATGVWQVEGDADVITKTERRQEILDALSDLGPSTSAAIAKAVAQDRGNTYKRLQDMCAAGWIQRKPKGSTVVYELVENTDQEEDDQEEIPI